MKKDNFLLVHNISLANMERVMDLGGMVCPSLAFITQESKFSYYGQVTLIADSELANPQEQPVFNADVFSPRYPDKKIEISRGKAFDYFGGIVEEINKRNGLSIGEKEIVDLCNFIMVNDKVDAKRCFFNNNLLVLIASDKHGVKIEQELVPISFRNKYSEIKGVREFILSINGDERKLLDRQKDLLNILDKHYEGILSSDELTRVGRIFAGNESRAVKEMILSNKGLCYSDNISLVDDFKSNAPKKKYIDGVTASISNHIDKIKGNNPFSVKDMSDIVEDVFDKIVEREYFYRQIEKGAYAGGVRKVDFNLKNLFAEMKSRLKNQSCFYLGLGNLKSIVAKRYRNMESIRVDVANEKIVSESIYSEKMDEIALRFKGIIERVINTSSEKGLFLSVDPFHFVGNAIFEYVQYRGKVDNAFSKAIRFDKSIGDDLAKIILDLKGTPSVYFEAKIQKIVYLEEFHTAVIPFDTSKDIVDGLVERGLKVKRYKEPDERLDILNSMMLGGKVKEIGVSMGV